jgi:hypothetical protein
VRFYFNESEPFGTLGDVGHHCAANLAVLAKVQFG